MNIFNNTFLRIEREKRTAPGRNKTRDLCYKTWAQPLSNNRCPAVGEIETTLPVAALAVAIVVAGGQQAQSSGQLCGS